MYKMSDVYKHFESCIAPFRDVYTTNDALGK